jgi:hypothetical protein
MSATRVIVLGLMTTAVFSAVAAAPQQSPSSDSSITVYEDANFKGRSLVFRGTVPTLGAHRFNDTISSVKVRGTRDWVLCESRNYLGRCVRVRVVRNLATFKMDNRVSSMYPVRKD